MRAFFPLSTGLAILTSTATAAVSPHTGQTVPSRPGIKAWPLHPGPAHAPSPSRDPSRTCYVNTSLASNGDDALAILSAFQQCNNGGTVVLDGKYTIASPLDLTFLEEVDVALTGTVGFGTDITYWLANTFKYTYQTTTAFWRFGGRDVNIFGDGVGLLNGNGQVWYDAFAANSSLLRPVLFVIDGLKGGSVTGLKMQNPPNWFNLIANSSDIIVSDLSLSVASTNSNPAKNTDGWDIYRSDNIVLQDSTVNNGDDCVSFKPNATNVVVQNLACNGSHGISVGSLGQYVEEYDIVENVYVYNISMSNASDGARIKVWPGIYTNFQTTLNGGGGAGYVKNVTYDGLHNTNNDWAIELTQCYGQSNQTLCNEYPSNMTIQDVVFKKMWGTTSTKYDPKVGTMVCSTPEKCINIQVQNVSIMPPSNKTAQWVCTNMNNTLLDINCIK